MTKVEWLNEDGTKSDFALAFGHATEIVVYNESIKAGYALRATDQLGNVIAYGVATEDGQAKLTDVELLS